MFGTSQLSHASARLEAAESENKRLKFKAERAGEVVLLDMPVDDTDGTISDNLEAEIEEINLQGKRGRLIFVPDEPSKGEE